MIDSTLDLKITFAGSDEILNEISNKLTSSTPDDTSLSDALSAIVKQTLIAAGAPSDFTVKIRRSQIRHNYGATGGLDAQEWLEHK
jgi:hypothetical protein